MREPWPSYFSSRLGQLHLDSGLTLKALADALGISAPYLHDLVYGRRAPTVKLVHRICKYIAADPDERLSWHRAAARTLGWDV